jgi:hypothetical protein
MVSGFKTSPLERRRIVSGEARLIVIFEKFDFCLLSLLNAMLIDILFVCVSFSPCILHAPERSHELS